MRYFGRVVHAFIVIETALLGGLVCFFAMGSAAFRWPAASAAIDWAVLALALIGLGLAVWGIRRKIGYRFLLPILVLTGAFVVFLAADDLDRPPPPDFGRIVSADSKSLEAYRWFLKKEDPHSRVSQLPEELSRVPRLPEKREERPEFVRKNREIFEQAWARDGIGREWVDVMAAQEPDGIYPPGGVDGPMLAFTPLRQSVMVRWGHAEVLMLDGKFDEAAAILVPLLRACHNLERAGSALVTQMSALVYIRGTFDRLEIMADTDRLSPPARAEVAAVLKEAPPLALVFRNAFLGERALIHATMDQLETDPKAATAAVSVVEGTKAGRLPFLRRLFFNPHRTEKEFYALYHEIAGLAERRELTADEKFAGDLEPEINRWRLKNQIGRGLMRMATPAFGKVVSFFWTTEDRRIALLKRLAPSP